jgi:hypothetical protein
MLREDFATIGEGAFLAQSVLLQRKHMDTRDLAKTVYVTYEAKKYAEEVSSVGTYTTVAVLFPDGSREEITPAGVNELSNRFRRYGPQYISEDITDIKQYLEPLTR